MSNENTARQHNSASAWDKLWKAEGKASWRGSALSTVYERINEILPKNAAILDIGGGVGILADYLRDNSKGRAVTVWDISPAAVKACKRSGHKAQVVDLEKSIPTIAPGSWVVSTEVIEHLTEETRSKLLTHIRDQNARVILSVPNFRLGPDEEPQHTIKWSAKEFRSYLQGFFGEEWVRVEVMGPLVNNPVNEPAFLVGIVGLPLPITKVSLTLPVRDEDMDLGRTLASFMGGVSEIVVGIDPRTKDMTWEVASRYADKVFYLEDPEGPVPDKTYFGSRTRIMSQAKEARVPDGGVHFAWVRNQCLDACTGEWVFMTEGHEPLATGLDVLRNMHKTPDGAKIAMVWRSDGLNQRWGFPWLARNIPSILYERGTHNSLKFPDNYLVIKLPQVRTIHERVHERSVERAAQRKIQNRIHLQDDWTTRGSEFSKYYLASEWREFDLDRSERHFQELLALPSKNGPMRYQARLILAKLLAQKAKAAGDTELAAVRDVLIQCSVDDWSRTEHWVWLGDIAFGRGAIEEAIQMYLYGAARLNDPPFTCWWIDMSFYSYIPAQRLTMAYAELGLVHKALEWARKVVELTPDRLPQLAAEAKDMVELLEKASSGDA